MKKKSSLLPTKNTGKAYEELVYNLYKSLEPNADVRINDKILGESEIYRQIDVSIRTKVADHDLLIIIQAKDHKKRVDIKILGEFASVIRDVGASKGILISSSGFAKTIEKAAKKHKIDLCSAYDAEHLTWTGIVSIPVIRKVTDIKFEIEFGFTVNEQLISASNGHIKIDAQKAKRIRKVNGEIISVIEQFRKAWDGGEISVSNGKSNFSMFEQGMEIEVMPNIFVVLTSLDVSYTVRYVNYFKFITPTDYAGIYNSINESFKATRVTYTDVIPGLDDGSWQLIDDISKISVKSSHINIDQFNFDEERAIKISLL